MNKLQKEIISQEQAEQFTKLFRSLKWYLEKTSDIKDKRVIGLRREIHKYINFSFRLISDMEFDNIHINVELLKEQDINRLLTDSIKQHCSSTIKKNGKKYRIPCQSIPLSYFINSSKQKTKRDLLFNDNINI